MGTEESNRFASKISVPQDQTLNKPLPPHWYTSMQAYHNSRSTPTTFLNPYAAGSYFYYCMRENQAYSATLQYDSLHDPSRLSNHPTVAEGAALPFSEKVPRTFSEKNLDAMKKCDGSLQPKSLITKESRENENRYSIPKNDRDRVSWSAASGSKGSSDEGHANNDFPSTKKQQCNMMLGNGEDAQKVTSIKNCLNASGINAQLAKLEEDEIRKERKRQSNRESARRSRIRKQQECERLYKNMNILSDENSSLTKKLKSLSEDCVELSNENDSVQEELVKLYGPESIADLLPLKPF